jgi:hypothetical protein
MDYDENRFMTRDLYESDVMFNQMLNYESTDSCLIQYRRDLPHHEWNLSPNEVLPKPSAFNYIYSRYDGQIYRIVENNNSVVTRFFYNGDLMVKKELYSKSDTIATMAWRYYYSDRQLTRIDCMENGILHFEYHFKDGLPNYIQYRYHRNNQLHYQYFYR